MIRFPDDLPIPAPGAVQPSVSITRPPQPVFTGQSTARLTLGGVTCPGRD